LQVAFVQLFGDGVALSKSTKREGLLQPYSYPRHTLLMDGLRAGFGLSITFGPLLFLTISRPLTIVLWGLGLIFLWFGCRLIAQCMISIVPADDGLSINGFRRWFFGWRDLTGLKLAYYAPFRRREAGWYRLTLVGKERAVRLDSTLDGFDDLLRSALAAAAGAKLAFDPSTRENLAAWAHRDDVPSTDGGDGALPSRTLPK
jgi:hypothetical protein